MTHDVTWFGAPRLARLEVQGFKSFLHRTVFAFEPGITAIVGPNGSGKSNVADAIRWVLGEQGQHALRARKTEDVIFSGGQGRAPAGLAEATLTFNNSDGWLPSEFAEVSVTRRAYRSGENHYLINGRRVRLKDVALLTSGLGQSHVVVGQGLVDAALSLRAEERRALFEHAADLTGLRLKVLEAERNLAETESNTARLNDLLLELAPRLKNLERAARQAREWQGLRGQLQALQWAHYREALQTAASQSARVEDEAAAAAAQVATARSEVARLTESGERANKRLNEARERLADHDERRGVLDDLLRRQTHERDLAQARLESLERRGADMTDARAGLDERVSGVTADLARLQTDLRELERTTGEAREAAARHRRAGESHRGARREIEARLAAAAVLLADSDRQEAEMRRDSAVLAERREAQEREADRLQSAVADRAERIASLHAESGGAMTVAAADDERAAAASEKRAELTAALSGATEELTAARREAERCERDRAETATRLDVLRRMHESGAGLHAGVREVLTAGRAGRLRGVRGSVAGLLAVPEAFEVAIEVALGGRLQDIVVDTWVHAEAAIALLKQSGVGRATFHPLDTVRGRPDQPAAAIGRAPGVRGVAAALVTTAPEIAPVAAALLGRTIVVDDLDTARGVLPLLGQGWSAVTLGGEIARAGGSLTGGAPTRESGALSRERELRELPGRVQALAASSTAARERVVAREATIQTLQAAVRDVENDIASLGAAAAERKRELDRIGRWLRELSDEQERAETRLDELRCERQTVADRLSEMQRELAQRQDRRTEAQAARASAEGELAELAASVAAAERAEAEEGRRLAGLEERLRGERRREAGLRAQERALAEELALRAERLAALDRERDALRAGHAKLAAETEASTRGLTALVTEREPLRIETMGAEIAVTRVSEALQTARNKLIECERAHDHASFARERAEQELAAVRQRIVEDLDLPAADEVLQGDLEPCTLPEQERSAEIGRLRERLRRIGYAGDDAVAEYEREAAQHAHLREQLHDVEGAAAALRDLLAELRQTMRARFAATFARVAAAFAETFAILFGGGTAQLVLAGGENGEEPGIDIVAQPPGKRLQNLALLSGGERALTAAALLLAILRVNPVPFCLLDEVDAALDEANVVRFRERLQLLAAQTQVIVVTHNRGTIEIADTLYGVSMGADGVSQVLSLRLSESLPAD